MYRKNNIILLLLFLSLSGVLSEDSTNSFVGKVVELEPVALDVVLPLYDNVIVFFSRQTEDNSEYIKMFEESVKQLKMS